MPSPDAKPKLDPQILLFRQLLNTWALVRRVMEPKFARTGLSSAQWGVIRALAIAEEDGKTELMPSELSQKLIVRPPSITGVLDRLQRQHLITRRPSETDGRVKLVRLTDTGRELIAQTRDRYTPHIKQLFENMSRADQRQFARLLTSLSDQLQHLAAEQESPAVQS